MRFRTFRIGSKQLVEARSRTCWWEEIGSSLMGSNLAPDT
jgi:hypothetical protein